MAPPTNSILERRLFSVSVSYMCNETLVCFWLLTTQTLVVMDSIWQEKSLDLNLVPYGCIATGHNIGTHKAIPSHTQTGWCPMLGGWFLLIMQSSFTPSALNGSALLCLDLDEVCPFGS